MQRFEHYWGTLSIKVAIVDSDADEGSGKVEEAVVSELSMLLYAGNVAESSGWWSNLSRQ